jgi:hypothetical protein
MKRHCLLAGIVDLEHIIIDELHLFLRLWDLIMNILLGYVEAVDREDVLERISTIFRVSFHRLDGEDEKGLQLWTPLDGNNAKKLVDGFSNNKSIFAEMFLLNGLPSKQKGKRINHQLVFERIFTLFSCLSSIVDYLRDEKKKLKTFVDFQTCVKQFITTLCQGWETAIKKMWYLHLLFAHLPFQLQKFGSIYFASCSAQEKLNDVHTHQLLLCTQKCVSSKQILIRSRRLIYYEHLYPSLIQAK